MPPGGGEGEGEGEHGITVQSHPPATVRLDEDDPPHSTPPLSDVPPVASKEKKQNLEQEQQPMPNVPEGALVEILSRVPYRSLCRFKCVSKPWLALCSAPDIRKRSPQTLSGFFYYEGQRLCFRNLSGRGPPLDPSLPFLRHSYKNVHVEQFCDSLLLCNCWNSCFSSKRDYVVCNPATQEWIVLPPVVFLGQDQEVSHDCPPSVYLGFEAAVPSRFVVFATPYNRGGLSGEMAIYSSETGQWTYVQTKWASESLLELTRNIRVFLNGTMHLSTRYNYNTMLTVDAEGKVWREIPMPSPKKSVIFCIGQSQGRLYAWQMAYRYGCELYIWVLEDYGTGKWAQKHTVNVLELFGRHCRKDGQYYEMFAFHPDCNVIFLTDEKEMTVSYDMDSQKNCNQLVIEYECSITCSAWDNTCCEN
uniref:Uncharacterized protein n=1 Tax=Aegilops tauschii TaxID=37682 RepID=M8ART8_AEGTA